MKARVRKTGGGWCAETRIEIGCDRVLQVLTVKSSFGLVTTAQVIVPGPRGYAYSPFVDFNERLREGRFMPCTEINVRSEHNLALINVDSLTARALAFYESADTVQ
jgi:hypothetical protein